MLIRDLAAYFATLSIQECDARFASTDCCVSVVLDLAEAVATPHHVQRGVVRRATDGRLQALFPAVIDAEPPAPRPPLTKAGVLQWVCESSPE
jgi:crotonobetainyl-CoA:carnitine CoA-transferase CaiB-like acyl-CoA transferase